MSSHEDHERHHKAHIVLSNRGKKMSFLEIQMALMQFDYISKRRRSSRKLRKQYRAINNKLMPNHKVPYNSSNDADEEDFDSDSFVDSDLNPEEGDEACKPLDMSKHLAREFRDMPVFDPDEPYLSSCSSMESLSASDRERSVKRMRVVRKLHRRRRRVHHLLFMGILNESVNTPHDADDEDDSDSDMDSNYSSGFDENECTTSSEDSEDEVENFNMNERKKRKINEAEMVAQPQPGSSKAINGYASYQDYYNKAKRQRLMVDEDTLSDENSC